MNSTEQFNQAQLTQWLWKTDAMQRMAIAIVELSLSKNEFASDDVPQDMEHGGAGICGSIFAKLEENKIIKKVGVFSGAEFFPKRKKSEREGRNAAKINVYELADEAKAKAFLRAKHRTKEMQQATMFYV